MNNIPHIYITCTPIIQNDEGIAYKISCIFNMPHMYFMNYTSSPFLCLSTDEKTEFNLAIICNVYEYSTPLQNCRKFLVLMSYAKLHFCSFVLFAALLIQPMYVPISCATSFVSMAEVVMSQPLVVFWWQFNWKDCNGCFCTQWAKGKQGRGKGKTSKRNWVKSIFIPRDNDS